MTRHEMDKTLFEKSYAAAKKIDMNLRDENPANVIIQHANPVLHFFQNTTKAAV